MQTKTKIIVSSITIIILTVVVVVFYRSKIDVPTTEQNLAPVVAQDQLQDESNKVQVPERTEFNTDVPTDFPTDIPLEKEAKVEQSYGLSYDGQKQLSIVFLSSKAVKDNFTLYTDFLSEQGWSVTNKYESEKLASLYGTKENNEINVTVNENITSASGKSLVSISVLKK
jgi:hypothetical protein